jgi:hypothetical protein
MPCNSLALIHGNYIILCSQVSVGGKGKGMVVEDLSEDTSLLEAERKAYWRNNAMRGLLGVMIAYEDKNGRAMTHEEVLENLHYLEWTPRSSSMRCSTVLTLPAG